MSLEQKIKDLLEQRQALAEKLTLPASNNAPGEVVPPKQGSSADAEVVELDQDAPGLDAAAKMKQEQPPVMVGDAKAAKVQSMESTAAELKAEVAGLFEGVEGLEEGFIAKATGVFEAAVIARTNAEVIKLTEQLEAKAEAELETLKTTLAEQVDKYVGYVVESWIKDNEVAIDAGLKTEIAESFLSGLKDLFTESFIQVPEEKLDVLEAVNKELGETKTKVDTLIAENADLSAQKIALEKAAVLESASKSLTTTDAERLVKLVEGVEFESKELFAEKVAVIREAHFKKAAKKSAETILAESMSGEGDQPAEVVLDAQMKAYVSTLSKNHTGF